QAIPADLFKDGYPKGADVILLGHILHDWSDTNCLKILSHCHDALPAGGVLLISETVLLPDHSSPTNFGMQKDLAMMIACESGSGERTEAEFCALLKEAGFDFVELKRFEAPRDLLVARKL